MNSARRSAGWTLSFSIAVLVGVAMPIADGCGPPCPDNFVVLPTYKIVTDRDDWEPGSGRLSATDTKFVISYTTRDGSKWEVEYQRTDSLP